MGGERVFRGFRYYRKLFGRYPLGGVLFGSKMLTRSVRNLVFIRIRVFRVNS